MSVGEQLAPFLGRLLIGGYFLSWAWSQSQDFEYWSSILLQKEIERGPVVLSLIMVLMGLGGLGLITGFRTKVAALVLFAVTAFLTLLLHDFWTLPHGAERVLQAQLFFKNMAIGGGLLVLVGSGPGGFALDADGD
ncbi:MAG: DoxX family membrane protein [Alphaproteobacteria bacterium]|nr:DoxX family membrane protein [Alphaproteobacteria bacterium]